MWYPQKPIFIALLLALFSVFGISQKAEASHALGAEITYECLGNNQYLVRVAFFYDCESTFTNFNFELDIASSCFNQSYTLNLQPPPPINPPFDTYLQPYEIPVYCEESNCGNGSLPGFLEYVYTRTVTLPPCSDYVFSFTENARSEAIETISTPGTEDIHVEARLNSVLAPCNNSPQFDLPARGILCLGQDNNMIHTATDFDGDQLVYSLYTPMTSATTTVNYLNPYTFTNPIQNNYFSLNNGIVSVWPTEQTITVMGILVEEYRNGVLIGSVMRDMQVRVVQNCPQNPEGVFETDGLAGFDVDSAFFCSADSINIDVFLDNTLAGPQYTIAVGNLSDFPGATFTLEDDTVNAGLVIGHFSWLPDFGNITSQSLVLTAYDDNCPVVGYTNFTYRFYFENIVLDANVGVTGIACNDSTLLTLDLDDPHGPVEYLWQDGSTGSTLWATPGAYSVSVEDSLGCTGTDTYVVFYNNYPVANFTVEPVCMNENIAPNDLSFNYAETGITPLELTDWNWNFGDGSGTSTDSLGQYSYSEPGTYTVTLVLGNENDCFDTATSTVVIHPLADFDITTNVACIGTVTNFANNSTIQSGSITNWSWDFDDLGATSTQQSPSHTFSEIAVYDVTVTATTNLGCESDTTFTANVVDEAAAAFTYEALPNCGQENLQIFFTNESERASAYLWDFENNVTDTATNPVYDTPTSNGPFVTLVAYAYPNEAACSDTATIDITDLFLTIDFDTINAGNIITPNADGFNDCLSPFWHESYEECYRLRIWDRWGMFIYDSDDIADGYCWPGTDRNGQPVSNGTFFFVAEVNSYSRSGSVYVYN
ncbi:MAG: gliding motility-associated C-terminal domain-containing protein [Flavobacteriales bacterium]|nr:gliding motility-associated C-terminal domain-containing protein [Flavobacteriales bacterium]